jgi:hypothetical protein
VVHLSLASDQVDLMGPDHRDSKAPQAIEVVDLIVRDLDLMGQGRTEVGDSTEEMIEEDSDLDLKIEMARLGVHLEAEEILIEEEAEEISGQG